MQVFIVTQPVKSSGFSKLGFITGAARAELALMDKASKRNKRCIRWATSKRELMKQTATLIPVTPSLLNIGKYIAQRVESLNAMTVSAMANMRGHLWGHPFKIQ